METNYSALLSEGYVGLVYIFGAQKMNPVSTVEEDISSSSKTPFEKTPI